MLADFQVALGRGVQKIPHPFVVDLEVRNFDGAPRATVLLQPPYSLKHVLANVGYDTVLLSIPHHGIRFSGTGLAVGKNTVIVTLKRIVQKGLSKVSVQVFLSSVVGSVLVEGPVGPVESERLDAGILSPFSGMSNVGRGRQDGLVIFHFHDTFCPAIDF